MLQLTPRIIDEKIIARSHRKIRQKSSHKVQALDIKQHLHHNYHEATTCSSDWHKRDTKKDSNGKKEAQINFCYDNDQFSNRKVMNLTAEVGNVRVRRCSFPHENHVFTAHRLRKMSFILEKKKHTTTKMANKIDVHD